MQKVPIWNLKSRARTTPQVSPVCVYRARRADGLNSPRAVAMSVYIIRAFVEMREDLAANGAILRRLAKIDKTLLIHDTALREILPKLRPLLDPPPAMPKPEIGFHIKEDSVPYRVRRKATRDYNLPPEQRATQRLVDQFNADERLWRKLAPDRRARRKLLRRIVSRKKLKKLDLEEFANARPGA
jgi:hypothetical protein